MKVIEMAACDCDVADWILTKQNRLLKRIRTNAAVLLLAYKSVLFGLSYYNLWGVSADRKKGRSENL